MVGKHCESGDVLVRDARVPADLGVGDVLATPVTGAYGHSMGSNYNKVPRPAVVFARAATPAWSCGARLTTTCCARTCSRHSPEGGTMTLRLRQALMQLGDLQYEPIDKRIRGVAGDRAVIDSRRAVLVWEPGRVVPHYAVPEDDVDGQIVAARRAGRDPDDTRSASTGSSTRPSRSRSTPPTVRP